MMANSFLNKVEDTIKKYNMFQKSEKLLACFSGGADSTALLLCLYKLGYKVKACHVDHCLRGAESDRDREFCVSLCEKLGVPIDVYRVDVKTYCAENSVSTEEGARILRYQCFEKSDAEKICTAHNASDCLETTLFNLARGTGLKGLCGVPVVRGRFVRPLIACTREEIENFLAECEQDYVTDSTNLVDDCSRNIIRHQILPTLKEINPSLLTSYCKNVDFLRSDSEYLEELADMAYADCICEGGYNAEKLVGLHESVRRRVIMRVLDNEKIECTADKIMGVEEILCGGKMNVKGDLFAVCSKNLLAFVSKKQLVQGDDEQFVVEQIGEYFFHERKICFNIVPYTDKIENVHKMFANYCLDYDKIKGVIVVRGRHEGDKIRLCNRDFESDVRKLLKKSFTLQDRANAVLISDDEGVVFVEKNGVSDRVKITEKTKRILVFTIS